MAPEMEERVIHAKGKRDQEEKVIRELDEKGILIRFAGKITRRHVSKNEDVYQIAMIACYDAIHRFDQERTKSPNFLAYLYIVMYGRIMKKPRRNILTLPLDDWMEFPVHPMDEYQQRIEWQEEITEYSKLLYRYKLTLKDIQANSPKHVDARQEQKQIAQWIFISGYADAFLSDQCNLSLLVRELKKSKRYFQRNRVYLKGLLLLYQPQFEKMRRFLSLGQGE